MHAAGTAAPKVCLEIARANAEGKQTQMGMTGRAWDIGFPTETHPHHAKAVGRSSPSEGTAPVRGCVKEQSAKVGVLLNRAGMDRTVADRAILSGKPCCANGDSRTSYRRSPKVSGILPTAQGTPRVGSRRGTFLGAPGFGGRPRACPRAASAGSPRGAGRGTRA